jgi:hypothetical protein
VPPRMPRENWPNYLRGKPHGLSCPCHRCRRAKSLARRALAEAMAGARSDESGAGRRIQSITLPGGFLGWSPPRSLVEVLRGGAGTSLFDAPGRRLLYRLELDPSVRQRLRIGKAVLYIGMVHGQQSSIRTRLREHLKGTGFETGEISRLRTALRALRRLGFGPTSVLVRYGEVVGSPPRYPLDPKLLRAYEAALQVLERPRAYVGSVTTFEREGQTDEGY